MVRTIMAADVGGTKTHFGLYRLEGGALSALKDQIYPTGRFKSLQDACAYFLSSAGGRPDAACFGVPGPVFAGRAQATNLPWTMEESSLGRELGGAPVRLVNDIVATAYGLIHLPSSDFALLHSGEQSADRGNVAVIAAGTGLGEAALVAGPGARYVAVPSEGGHADFAPQAGEQVDLLRFLARQFGHVSLERVLSGPGLLNIYRFLREQTGGVEPQWLSEQLTREDPAAAISEAGLAASDPRCAKALEIFAAVYGAEAGNAALRCLALGGVYLAGGIAPKILPMLRRGGFVRAFRDKGRLEQLLARIDVRVSLNEGAALIGAAHCACEML